MPTTIPTTTSSTRPGSSSAGDAYFETDTKNYIIYDGANWRVYNNDGIAAAPITNTYSVDFDGTNDYMDISGAASSLNSVTAFSISLWYNLDAYGGALVGSGTGNTNGIWLQPFTDGNFYVVIRNGATNTLSATVPSLSTWVHAVVTYNTGTIKLYLTPSGGSTDITTITNGPSSTSSTMGTDLSIGRLAWLTSNPYYINGKVDEVAIFDYELTSSQVSIIYNSGTPADVSLLNPLGWWRMGDNDSGTGTTVTDQGSGGNNGTLTNGPTFSTLVPS
jgi:hypothetical protein